MNAGPANTGKQTVGGLVAAMLAEAGVRRAFGVISIHNMPMLEALSQDGRIAFTMARGEAGAVHMADGHARVSGGLGVAFSSTGPGAANAAGGLFEAMSASTPLLHLTGQTPLERIGRDQAVVHDAPRQLDMLAALSKAAYRVTSPQTAQAVLAQAIRTALAPPRGPVSVEIPIDIQSAPLSFAPPLLLPPAPLPQPPEAGIAALAEAVRRARRPMLWLGGGARDAGEAALRLLDKGFCAVSSWNGRGIVPDGHERSLGAYGGAVSRNVEELYAGVDLMIVAGSRLRGQHTRNMALKLPENLVHIDVDPLARDRTYRAASFLPGDAAGTLSRLAELLPARLDVDPAFGTDVASARAVADEALLAATGPYRGFAAQLRAAMPAGSVLARDITLSNSTWAQYAYPVAGPRETLYPVGGGIGAGVGLGIGAALAALPHRTAILCGDGGFFAGLAELATAVQDGARPVFIVMNDKGYGIIRQVQDAPPGGSYYVDLANPDLAATAASLGMGHQAVRDVSRFGEAVSRALGEERGAIVEVDMAATGAFPVTPTLAQRRTG